ncbi:glycine cleavage system protein H [Ottowia testudinis]|uniref:Glycine cleavage system protein H n=1 Tax=Ottowia testudinis TaxID=2816950 RepID=A0A975H4I2_9BURK|nr:glycine cleavage system protein H [Ottowia testudinis]QTD46395.1 glycine cleavage system protein H [Ottowia testudinis]
MTEITFPADLHYLIEHQVWARPHGDGTATVGITALGIQLSGEIYMCRPKSVGVAVAQGHAIAVVELAKSIVAVKSPVTGTVIAVNPLLDEHPERVHQDPYGDGWIARVTLSDFAADAARLVHGPLVAPAMAAHARLFRASLDNA